MPCVECVLGHLDEVAQILAIIILFGLVIEPLKEWKNSVFIVFVAFVVIVKYIGIPIPFFGDWFALLVCIGFWALLGYTKDWGDWAGGLVSPAFN